MCSCQDSIIREVLQKTFIKSNAMNMTVFHSNIKEAEDVLGTSTQSTLERAALIPRSRSIVCPQNTVQNDTESLFECDTLWSAQDYQTRMGTPL